ncbi:Protein gamma response 1 [Arabidopsis thaliana]|jgi:splicing factor 4|uniref:Protein gamma response 1 n=4 Tax=Arabidopsis TaxID=3701 RepID=GR1_ARATH|nr:protein gamma response 1 [Arabidopsis thaliana]Q9ZRT1.2 RecName: Full=Protein gamma response 1; AltName: Full=COM1/SAE2-like protein; AltName: Full=Protein gamma response I [Arabidopsis thaliana]KAG7628201.1 DNA endonuclease Ctp1 C-terminal [Arabidopsis thaliana x Arabidopsis arenosa]KAG7634112.1 DNA endonuclease Ctp1 C-terminal [Arabidopsis suecica]ABI95360.1 COM1/SAE2-like protein [Arabidopsis thaliana]AEE78895.1 protein gamma response 1 [Arabidopsis thaliana]OAP01797.1 GR1 [Arabidopsis |eukprot:NP_850683.1 protein gamma response 1 [Arabidopsis thaliana]
MGDETVDGIEAKYISGLSTIMVATIQEAKDRISQIEYIFCSQLFPNFQSKSKAFEKVYSEARLAACDTWKDREKSLLDQIEELKVENQQIKSDKEKLAEELGKTASMPLRLTSLQGYIDHLKKKMKSRSKMVGDARDLYYRLVELLQVKGLDELSEDGINMIVSEVKSLKMKTEFLQEELSKKTLVTENLLKKLEYLSTEAADGERKLSSVEEEKQRLKTRLQVFEENVGRLEEILRQKTDEVEEGKTALEVLQGKLKLTEREMLNCKQKIADHEKEKTVVMGKAKDDMQGRHGSYLADLEALRCQSEEKSFELAMEIKKNKELSRTCKKWKSQHTFLCKRFNFTPDSVLHQSSLEDENKEIGQHEKSAISSYLERKHSETAEGADKVRIGTGSSGNNYEKESIIKTVQTPITSISPIVRSPGAAKPPQLSGLKRPASIWRDTRSRQSPGGHDPHDDFLDTPIENVKRVAGEEKHVHDVAKKDDSDDETQDMNPKPSPSRQRIQIAETSKKSFKHVESVRKKAERENLKGIECKQCKKFYDAVHPENEGNGNKSLRCEHHEGVSRHRYRYAPPMTPEGFWNIGFESEM